MEQWVGHVTESPPGWNPMQRFGIGWVVSDKVVNKRFDPYVYVYVLCLCVNKRFDPYVYVYVKI